MENRQNSTKKKKKIPRWPENGGCLNKIKIVMEKKKSQVYLLTNITNYKSPWWPKTNSKLVYLQVCRLDRAKSSLPALPSTGISMGPCARQAASGLLHFYLGRAGLGSTSAFWVLFTLPLTQFPSLHVSFVEVAIRAHSISQTGNIHDTSLWSSRPF